MIIVSYLVLLWAAESTCHCLFTLKRHVLLLLFLHLFNELKPHLFHCCRHFLRMNFFWSFGDNILLVGFLKNDEQFHGFDVNQLCTIMREKVYFKFLDEFGEDFEDVFRIFSVSIFSEINVHFLNLEHRFVVEIKQLHDGIGRTRDKLLQTQKINSIAYETPSSKRPSKTR